MLKGEKFGPKPPAVAASFLRRTSAVSDFRLASLLLFSNNLHSAEYGLVNYSVQRSLLKVFAAKPAKLL